MRSLLGLLAGLWFTVALSASPTPKRLRRDDTTTDSTSLFSSNSSSTSTATRATTPAVRKLNFIAVNLVTSSSETPTPIPLGTLSSSSTQSTKTTTKPAPIKFQPVAGLDGLDVTSTSSSTPTPDSTSDAVPSTSSDAPSSSIDVPLTTSPPTSLVTLPSSSAPYPLPNGTVTMPPGVAGTGTAGGDSCGGCTINVNGASVDYWFPATFSYGLGTLSTVTGSTTSWFTLALATTTFDFLAASAEGAYTTSISFFEGWDFYVTLMDSYTIKPSAVSTSLISRSSVLPVTGTVAMEDFDFLYVDPGPATIAIPSPAAAVTTVTSTTPFVYFSAYEVASATTTTLPDGGVMCSRTTATVNLTQPYAFDYVGNSLEEAAHANGDLPSDFLNRIPESSCVAGKWSGDVTVLVVVDLLYDKEFNPKPFGEHVESTASSGFDDDGFTPEAGHISTTISHTGGGIGGIGGPGGIGDLTTPNAGGGGGTFATTRTRGIGFTQIQFPPLPTSSTVVVGTQTASAGTSSQVIIGSQTLTPGGPPITVDSTPVSLAPSGTAIVIGGSTAIITPPASGGGVIVAQPKPTPGRVPVITVGSSTVTGNAATQFFFGPGTTLTPGGSVVVSGTTVSLDPSASWLVVGDSTIALPTPAPSIAGVITVGATTVTGDGGNTFVVGGQTLIPGGPAITVDGPEGQTTISLAPGGGAVIINGATQVVSPVLTPTPLTIGGATFSASDGTAFIIGTQTLRPGDVITLTGNDGQATTVSLGPSASWAVVNGMTTTLITDPSTATNAPLLTINGVVYTALPGTSYVIDGQTLAPGGTIVVDGMTISLSPYATALIINGHTTTLFPATTTDAGRTGLVAPTPTATTTKKNAAASIHRSSENEFVMVGLSAIFGAFVASALWL